MTRRGKIHALLWVIVAVIGVVLIVGALMPCCPGQEGSPEAVIIRDNMRHLKTAVLMWYADNYESFDRERRIDGQTIDAYASTPENATSIMKYCTDNDAITLKGSGAKTGEYMLISGKNSGDLFIGYSICPKKQRVKDGLARWAKSAGLLAMPETDSPPYTSRGENTSRVWMKIF